MTCWNNKTIWLEPSYVFSGVNKQSILDYEPTP